MWVTECDDGSGLGSLKHRRLWPTKHRGLLSVWAVRVKFRSGVVWKFWSVAFTSQGLGSFPQPAMFVSFQLGLCQR